MHSSQKRPHNLLLKSFQFINRDRITSEHPLGADPYTSISARNRSVLVTALISQHFSNFPCKHALGNGRSPVKLQLDAYATLSPTSLSLSLPLSLSLSLSLSLILAFLTLSHRQPRFRLELEIERGKVSELSSIRMLNEAATSRHGTQEAMTVLLTLARMTID